MRSEAFSPAPEPAVPAAPVCRLCASPIPLGTNPGDFCCAGCERVFEVLQNLDPDSGAEYVEAARRMGVIPAASGEAPAARPGSALPDDPAAVREERFSCRGMACPSCSWVVEQVLLGADGVFEASVDYFTASAKVRYDMRSQAPDTLAALLRPLGYELERWRDERQQGASRRATMELVISAVLFLNVMSLATVRYAERAEWIDHAPHGLAWLELALTVPILLIGWVPALRRAAAGLRAGRPTMDLLIVTAVGAATGLSVAALLEGRDEIYFETAAGLTTIFGLSRMVESRLRGRALDKLGGLLKMKVAHVRLLDESGAPRYVPVAEVCAGDRVAFEPEETVAFDGRVESFAGVSEAVLTGEPTALLKTPGGRVMAGSVVTQGRLEVRVERRYGETRLCAIAESLARALERAETRLRTADRIALVFVPAVLAVSAAVWIIRLGMFGLDHALSPDGWFPSVTVLAVACPCAFSLAGIAAVTAATAGLLDEGLLVKDPAQLEHLSRVRHVVFDKTGTLTEGCMALEALVWDGSPDDELLSDVACLERDALHPAARAISEHLAKLGLGGDLDPDRARDVPGKGRTGRVGGRMVEIGSAPLFEAVFTPEGLEPGHTAVWFGRGGRARGCFLLEDRLRPESHRVVSALSAAGLTTRVVSGDRPEVAEKIARRLNMTDSSGGVSVKDKAAAVERLRAEGPVAFVGDGTNDALAMGAADVSVAVSRSTDEALAASGVVALSGGLDGLPELWRVGRKLRRVIASNYVWAFAFNTTFIPVAAAGELAPLTAMLLMLASSTAVLLNSSRMRSRPSGPGGQGDFGTTKGRSNAARARAS